MILSKLFLASKSKWQEARERALREDFAPREAQIKAEIASIEARITKERDEALLLHDALNAEIKESESRLERRKEELTREERIIENQRLDLEDLKKRNEDRRLELERANEELKMQIRLIEAKARPDSIFIEAFSLGVSKSWDSLSPLITGNFERIKEKIKTDAIEETRKNLEPFLGNKVHTNKP